MENKKSIFSSVFQTNHQENKTPVQDDSGLKAYLEKIDKRLLELDKKIIANEKSEEYIKRIEEIAKKIDKQEEFYKSVNSVFQENLQKNSQLSQDDSGLKAYLEKIDKRLLELDKKIIANEKSEEYIKRIEEIAKKIDKQEEGYKSITFMFDENFKRLSEFMRKEVSSFENDLERINNFSKKENDDYKIEVSECFNQIAKDVRDLLEKNESIRLLINESYVNNLNKLEHLEKKIISLNTFIDSLDKNLAKAGEKINNLDNLTKNIELCVKSLEDKILYEQSKLRELLVCDTDTIIEKITQSFKSMEDNTLKLYFNNVGENIEVEKMRFKLKEMYEETIKTYKKTNLLISEIEKEKLNNLPGVSGDIMRKKLNEIEKVGQMLKLNIETIESIKDII